MFVNTNVAALNAWRNLDNTQMQMTSVLQQLSSGYRINTAANDPAGLAISQQMQSQINGMNQAYQNSQAGITLLQTADGAMGQVQNILQSMYSLASEAATGTNNSTDRAALQQEMNQYAQEITQIANTTQFNNLNLLGGVFQNTAIQIGANQGQSLTISIAAADAYSLGVSGEAISSATAGALGLVQSSTTPAILGLPTTAAGSYDMLTFQTQPWTPTVTTSSTLVFTAISGTYNSATSESIALSVVSTSATTVTATYTITYASGTTSTGTVTGTNSTAAASFSITDANGNSLNFSTGTLATTAETATVAIAPQQTNYYVQNSGSYSLSAPSTSALVSTQSVIYGAISAGQEINLQNATTAATEVFSFTAGGNTPTTALSWTLTSNAVSAVTTTTGSTYYTAGAASPFDLTAAATGDIYTFQITSNGGAAGSGTPSNFTNATITSGPNISTQATATAALSVLQNAINQVSSNRATIGAFQNRLQFAARQLQTTSQNLTTARAGIMDADVALQMANLTRYQVLQQAGVAMLAQANAMPQALLKLFP